MAAKPDVSGYESYAQVEKRLDEITAAVKDKGTSLERSLDLFDEAIALGSRAVDLVDKAAFSPEERERIASTPVDDAAASETPASDGSDAAVGTADGATSAGQPTGAAAEQGSGSAAN